MQRSINLLKDDRKIHGVTYKKLIFALYFLNQIKHDFGDITIKRY